VFFYSNIFLAVIFKGLTTCLPQSHLNLYCMKKNLLACACIMLCLYTNAQNYFYNNNYYEPTWLTEAGISFGGINCLTDIGGKKGVGKKFIKDVNWNFTRPCTGIFVSSTWQSKIAVRLQATFGSVYGNDAVLKGNNDISKARYNRNLHFKTSIAELSFLLEIHPLCFLYPQNENSISPYLITGVGNCHYNPQAKLNNVWVNLRPLHTEGQGFAEYAERNVYKPNTVCLPVGAGLRYDAAANINLRIEFLYAILTTDYLDDVSKNYIDATLFSKYLNNYQLAMAKQLADRRDELGNTSIKLNNNQRGNAADNDAYFSLQLKLSVCLNRKKR
jgi:Domain of unknown function (DUF6089)